MQREIIITKDGSSSIFVPELNETYHSIHGAKNEAIHVFIQMGYHKLVDKFQPLKILEIGLGTGLNACLTLAEAQKNKHSIQYTAIEKYPVHLNELKLLNYTDFLSSEDLHWIHESAWNNPVQHPKNNFILQKLQIDIVDIPIAEKYHLIYFDAFAPNKQPKMWTKEILGTMYKILLPNGLLTTYCCRGEVKRTLQEVGFKVEKVPGPPGKREMINAWKV